MRTQQPVSPLGYLFVMVLHDHNELRPGEGLTREQIIWNIRNMPTDQKRKNLIMGLTNGSIDPNPFNWPDSTLPIIQEE